MVRAKDAGKYTHSEARGVTQHWQDSLMMWVSGF